MKYDYLIVGSGLFGAVCAERLTHAGKRCLVIDKNPFVGGNCHTSLQDGIMVHSFGPHTFHTNNKDVWEYVNRFATFAPIRTTTKAFAKGKMYSFPVNLLTLHQLWGVTTPQEAIAVLDSKRHSIPSPQNFEEYYLSTVGKELYELFFEGYTTKQWMVHPSKLDISLARRIPIRTTFDDRYYNDLYQGLPIEGYTKMIENILKNVECRLNVPFSHSLERKAKHTIYTGRIDQYYDFCFGKLPYRTQTFVNETVNVNDFQGCAVVNYPDLDTPFTRITEHKHLTYNCPNNATTIITREFPVVWNELQSPLYPSLIPSDRFRYLKYMELSKNGNTYFGGRLGTYSYLNMDETIEQALDLCAKLSLLTTTNT